MKEHLVSSPNWYLTWLGYAVLVFHKDIRVPMCIGVIQERECSQKSLRIINELPLQTIENALFLELISN